MSGQEAVANLLVCAVLDGCTDLVNMLLTMLITKQKRNECTQKCNHSKINIIGEKTTVDRE